MENRGILLIGHGSRREDYRKFVEDTAEILQNNHPECTIRTCYLEHMSPAIPEGLELLKKENPDVIIAVPLLLSKGVHILETIPRLLGLKEGSHANTVTLASGKNIPLLYANPIGADPLLADLLFRNAEQAQKEYK